MQVEGLYEIRQGRALKASLVVEEQKMCRKYQSKSEILTSLVRGATHEMAHELFLEVKPDNLTHLNLGDVPEGILCPDIDRTCAQCLPKCVSTINLEERQKRCQRICSTYISVHTKIQTLKQRDSNSV